MIFFSLCFGSIIIFQDFFKIHLLSYYLINLASNFQKTKLYIRRVAIEDFVHKTFRIKLEDDRARVAE